MIEAKLSYRWIASNMSARYEGESSLSRLVLEENEEEDKTSLIERAKRSHKKRMPGHDVDIIVNEFFYD